jgi:hypothetical protein
MEVSPDESGGDTWMSQGLKGPRGCKPTQLLTSIKDTPMGPYIIHCENDGGERTQRGFG